MDLELKTVDTVNIEPELTYNTRSLRVDLTGVSKDEVLEQIDIKDAISYYGADKLLDSIGRDEAILHFDLGPEEEQ